MSFIFPKQFTLNFNLKKVLKYQVCEKFVMTSLMYISMREEIFWLKKNPVVVIRRIFSDLNIN